ncbi:MAG: hypothetical protein AB2693_32050 [Candidatus Thiodiazotropha sp.]
MIVYSSLVYTENCSELYNHESGGDCGYGLQSVPEEDQQPILHEGVKIAVAALKKGKSAGVDNILAELVQEGRETMIDDLTEICNSIGRTGEWPTLWTQSLIITLPKKDNLQLCQNYRTIRTQAFEMISYRRLLNISYKDHINNEEVRRKIQAAIGKYDELLTMIKKRKLRWFGHVSRSSGLAKTVLQGTVNGKRRGGRQKTRWEDNIKEWKGMDFASSSGAAEYRRRWKRIVSKSSVVPQRPCKDR